MIMYQVSYDSFRQEGWLQRWKSSYSFFSYVNIVDINQMPSNQGKMQELAAMATSIWISPVNIIIVKYLTQIEFIKELD